MRNSSKTLAPQSSARLITTSGEYRVRGAGGERLNRDWEISNGGVGLDQRARGRAQDAGSERIWPGRRWLASRSCGLAWAMHGQAAPLPRLDAASFQRE